MWEKIPWNKISRHKYLSVEDIDVEENEVEEDLQNIIMQQSIRYLHINRQREEKYGANIISNVITPRNFDTMNKNAKRNNQINKEEVSISPTMKENLLKPCFFCAIFLKTITKMIFGCWIVVVATI